MHIPLNADTRDFWQSVHTWKTRFPYFAIALSYRPYSSGVKLTPQGPFGRGHAIPAPPQYSITAWCFESISQRDLFVSTYKAERMEIR